MFRVVSGGRGKIWTASGANKDNILPANPPHWTSLLCNIPNCIIISFSCEICFSWNCQLNHPFPWLSRGQETCQGLCPELGLWNPSPRRAWGWLAHLPSQIKQNGGSARPTRGRSSVPSLLSAAGSCLSERNRFARWNGCLVSLADRGNTPATLPLPANQAVS